MQTERYFSPRYAQSLIPGMGRILLFIILVFSALHSYGYVVPGGATGECTANYDYFQHSSQDRKSVV